VEPTSAAYGIILVLNEVSFELLPQGSRKIRPSLQTFYPTAPSKMLKGLKVIATGHLSKRVHGIVLALHSNSQPPRNCAPSYASTFNFFFGGGGLNGTGCQLPKIHGPEEKHVLHIKRRKRRQPFGH
jgi:hypothetical protein